ncbi:hypothetical protein GQ53DRAFT_707487 [Thozetella sp. PMI_491]|nr:hypothetical protein GQ53DRAFT_707487 [Thozetella sp. PMI_491]
MAATANTPPCATFVQKVYRPVGFTKGYNFVLWFIFGGALVGFALARLQFLDYFHVFCNPDRSQKSQGAPGECFYFSQPFYALGMILHLAGVLPASLLAFLQFIPAIRHKAILFHRVNGYAVILLSITGCIGAFMILRPTFGGSIDIQTAGGLLGIAFACALAIAWISIKRLRLDLHRAWMLRAWVWAGSIITIRIILFIGSVVIPMTGTYYFSERCDKVAWLFENDQNKTLYVYPECEAFFSGQNSNQHVSIKAQFLDSTLAEKMSVMNMIFGASMWLGLSLHAFGVELYLYLTPAETERLRQISFQRQLAAGKKTTSGDS